MGATETHIDQRDSGSARERLAGDLADVVRDEVRTIRTDLSDAARPATSGLLLVAAAAGCAVLSVGAASVMALRVFETLLPKTLAAAGLTIGSLVSARALANAGLARLETAGGSSKRLADGLRQAMRETVRPARQAAVAAARDGATQR